jgi:hypothetical protein
MLPIVFAVFSSQEIKHAPNVEQCRADLALWDDQLFDYAKAAAAQMNQGSKLVVPAHTEIGKLTARQLNAHSEEMLHCYVVDKDADYQRTYSRVISGLSNARSARFEDFVLRHGYMKKLILEDEAGLR